MPATQVTYNINSLKPLANPADLLGKNMELESLDGSQNYKAPVPLFIRTVSENLPASTKTTHIIARTWDTANSNYIAGDETFLSIVAKQQLVHMMTARVEFPYPSREYRLVFDPRGGYLAFRDSTFTGGLNPVSWVEIDSEADVTKGVEDFNALLPNYAKGATVKYNLDGRLRLFTAVKDLEQVNGSISAPVAAGDTNWLEVNAATNTKIIDWLPGSYKKNEIVLYQGVIYRARRDVILGDQDENQQDFYDYPKPAFWEAVGGEELVVEQDLSSYSETSVPSVSAVASALDAATAALQVTYNQLVNLIYSGGLKAGNFYLLIDFQLTHTIPNTSTLWTSATEQLLLLASSSRTIAAQGYSITYPSDIVYYNVFNNNTLMPGSTKGYISRRYDVKQNNDIEIDFRNVRFRRWLTTLPQPTIDGGTELYIGFADNGRAFQDLPMFGLYTDKVYNNLWIGYNSGRDSIFGQINFVTQGDSPTRNNKFIGTTILNVNVHNTFFYESYYLKSILRNVNIIRTGFYTYLFGNMTNSTISDRYVSGNDSGYNLYATNVTTEAIAGKTLIGGKDISLLNSTFTPTAIKSVVSAGTYTSGELQGSQPGGSVAGMKFTDTAYRYEYATSAADTDATSYVWIRTAKA